MKSRTLGMLLFLVLCLMVVAPMSALANEVDSSQTTLALYSGVVTANQGNGIQINHESYGLHKELTVQDDDGRERKLQELKTGVRVQFHLKQGKVDQLILKLAR